MVSSRRSSYSFRIRPASSCIDMVEAPLRLHSAQAPFVSIEKDNTRTDKSISDHTPGTDKWDYPPMLRCVSLFLRYAQGDTAILLPTLVGAVVCHGMIFAVALSIDAIWCHAEFDQLRLNVVSTILTQPE